MNSSPFRRAHELEVTVHTIIRDHAKPNNEKILSVKRILFLPFLLSFTYLCSGHRTEYMRIKHIDTPRRKTHHAIPLGHPIKSFAFDCYSAPPPESVKQKPRAARVHPCSYQRVGHHRLPILCAALYALGGSNVVRPRLLFSCIYTRARAPPSRAHTRGINNDIHVSGE